MSTSAYQNDDRPCEHGKMVPSSTAVSRRMSVHPRRDTGPEMRLRKLLHAAGLRYRVQLPVPGIARRTVDIAFTRSKVAVFVDGCFWHGCPEHGTVPAANNLWWRGKLDGTRRRDAETELHLTHLSWTVLRVWEHESTAAAAARVITEVRLARERAVS